MKPVSLKKLGQDELAVLQEMVKVYSDELATKVKPQLTFQFYEFVLEVDILKRLFLTLRGKIEAGKLETSITLKASEAVVLLYACNYACNTQNMYANVIGIKVQNFIDQELKSNIVVQKAPAPQPQKLLQ